MLQLCSVAEPSGESCLMLFCYLKLNAHQIRTFGLALGHVL